jgi:hypothetical protein
MNATQPELVVLKHLNRGLFSDYYLDQIAPTLPEWQDNVLFTRVLAARDELRALLGGLRPEALDEAQLEEQWVKPVLEKLGHHWSVQVKIRYRDTGFRKPDYVFTATAEAANALTNQIYQPAELTHALALGDAKRWGAKLDQASGAERNPSQQIDEYLRYSELPWGLLTDGRFWRLYHRDSSKDNVYYAVDLPALLRNKDPDAVHAFYYFYLFFRQQAFVKAGWLERVLQGSMEYAESLSDELEDAVYEALELIAEGFLRYRRNRLKADPDTRKLIYQQSLILLYRLLFVAYAESRDILPLSDNEAYREGQSLLVTREEAAELADFRPTREGRRVDEATFYERLSALFFNIDQGSPEYDIAPYNGHLFSEEQHRFLAENRVGDAYLIDALDKLTRVPDRNNPRKRVFVDYRDLDVRHLGAIYEKLLEYELDVADQPLKIKNNKYIPAGADEADIQPGEVYLRTGNHERKISGSYYTPDYIVGFIVERTLEPLLTEITTRYADQDSEGHWIIREPEALRAAILSINVLDPATGSGHFLVEAVAYIAEWLRRLGLKPADMAADEDELVYWKRQVVTSCIYGVDLNPLAVELAKLSLWLTTIARGKPLSFLDHHVKVGNTLVGAMASRIRADVPENNGDGQLSLFEDFDFSRTVSAAVSNMRAIENTIAINVDQVKEQERAYAELREALAPLRQLADMWTERHFGLEAKDHVWRVLFQLAAEGHSLDESSLTEVANQYHFFHWDLEFPEVFFAPDGQPLAEPGFDAVIGNPPYVRQERIQPIKPYLEAHYDVYQGTADLFLYFYERALTLVKPAQRVGYITSGTFMNSHSATAFRKYIRDHAAFEYAVNFGENQPFKDAEMVYPTMAILRRGKPSPTFRSLFVEDVYPRDQLGEAVATLPLVDAASDVTALDEWRFQSVELTRLFRKVTEGYQTLDEFCDGGIYSGVKTGLNDAFIIDDAIATLLINEDAASRDIIKPVFRGQDLRPWYQIQSEPLFLIQGYQGVKIDTYPAVKGYLEQFKSQLEPKPIDWDTRKKGDWKGRAAGNHAWYEWQAYPAYRLDFEKPKICWPDISKLPRFSWNEETYLINTGFMITEPKYSLLAVLQSRPLWFAISQIAQPLRLRAGLWQYRAIPQFIERLPIPKLTAAQESSLAELAEQITGLARGRYQQHESVRHRVRDDLGAGGSLNNALTEWWELDFADFRKQVKTAFQREIPVGERDEWERYLADQQEKHRQATDQIIALETRLNAIVYQAFKLTPDEIALIEQATKYPYGAV